MHMEYTKHRHICWALPPSDRVAWPCERLPFWYMPIWLWRQDTRLNMFICHTQRPPGSLNRWRVTWDQRLQVCKTFSMNMVGSALAWLPIYWDQGERAPQAYPSWTTWQASRGEGQIQSWTWNPNPWHQIPVFQSWYMDHIFRTTQETKLHSNNSNM